MPYIPNRLVKIEGNTSRKAHANIPDGAFEIEHGRNGFFGRVSHLYKSNQPTRWRRLEGPLKHHQFNLKEMRTEDQDDPTKNPTQIFYNNEVEISLSKIKQEMPYYARNADGDLCIFVHRGYGVMESDYGRLDFRKGDYLIIPRGTSYRLVPKTTDNFFLQIEATGSEYDFPDRGMLGPTAQIDPAMIETPKLPDEPTRLHDEWEVRVKKYDDYTSVFYPFNPVEDTIGYKGSVFPFKVNILDFNPVTSPKYHLPPSVHTTFLPNNKSFVICSFVPRPLEDPDVLRIPYYHSNVEFEELLFYHDGNFFSRHGINEADITLHPPGILHGPQPQAFEKVQNNPDKTHTDEVAVMVDTVNPLLISDAVKAVENPDYINSWKTD